LGGKAPRITNLSTSAPLNIRLIELKKNRKYMIVIMIITISLYNYIYIIILIMILELSDILHLMRKLANP